VKRGGGDGASRYQPVGKQKQGGGNSQRSTYTKALKEKNKKRKTLGPRNCRKNIKSTASKTASQSSAKKAQRLCSSKES